MKLDADQLAKLFSRFLHRYHVVLYSLTIVIGVAIAVWMVSGVMGMSQQYDAITMPPATFDQATIDRLDTLSTSTNPVNNFSLPAGRTNPFAE
ncbi:MAG: hypothetical protein Q4B05_00370 [Candidatus Saccharibacteria bacterium]|nr:hypothetical protein [Candidatus Saccharibacteria bacterium]